MRGVVDVWAGFNFMNIAEKWQQPVCLWGLSVVHFHWLGTKKLLKDIYLSLFYWTIKLYLWGQYVRTFGFFFYIYCLSWTPTQQSLLPHCPIYRRLYFLHHCYRSNCSNPHTVKAQWYLKTESNHVKNADNVLDDRELDIKGLWTQLYGWMTEQTETETAINHSRHSNIKPELWSAVQVLQRGEGRHLTFQDHLPPKMCNRQSRPPQKNTLFLCQMFKN